jgi:hypothetical protein
VSRNTLARLHYEILKQGKTCNVLRTVSAQFGKPRRTFSGLAAPGHRTVTGRSPGGDRLVLEASKMRLPPSREIVACATL